MPVGARCASRDSDQGFRSMEQDETTGPLPARSVRPAFPARAKRARGEEGGGGAAQVLRLRPNVRTRPGLCRASSLLVAPVALPVRGPEAFRGHRDILSGAACRSRKTPARSTVDQLVGAIPSLPQVAP